MNLTLKPIETIEMQDARFSLVLVYKNYRICRIYGKTKFFFFGSLVNYLNYRVHLRRHFSAAFSNVCHLNLNT